MNSSDTSGELPRTIRLFERVQITALAVGWANAALSYDASLRGKISPYLFGLALIVVSIAVVLVIHRISRRRSLTGVWILTALSVFFAVPWLVLVYHVGLGHWTGMLLVFQGVLQAVSLGLLAGEDARNWIAWKDT